MASLSGRPIASALLGAALAAGLWVTTSSSAAAQASGSLELVAQSSWVDDGGIFNLQVRAAGADPASTVVLNVYPPHQSRDELISEPDPEQQPLLQLGPLPLANLQTTSNEILSLEVAIAGPGIDETTSEVADASEIPVLVTDEDSAVYPIEIVLQDPQGEVADTVRTTLIKLRRGQRLQPLQVVILLQSTQPVGLAQDAERGLIEAAGEDLFPMVEAFALHPDTAIALSISPESLVAFNLSDIERHQQLSGALQEQLNEEELFAAPYVRVDEQTWIDGGLEKELAKLYEAGSDAVRTIVGVEPDTTVAILDQSLGPDGLEWLVDQGVRGVFVDSDQLAPLDADVFDRPLTRRFLIPIADSGTVPALQSDDQLKLHFAETTNPVLDANRMLGDLALIALEEPGRRRTVVVSPPDDWVPDLAFLNVLLGGLERIPIITASTPAAALANTEFTPASGDGSISPPLRRELRPNRAPTRIGGYRTDFNQAAAAITSWQTVIAADPASTDLLDELLLLSADERLSKQQRDSYIDTIYRIIDEQKTSAIRTPPADQITVTGRETVVTLVIENDLTVDAEVLVVLDSEKLLFPEGREMPLTLAPGTNRIDIPIEARASGDSPIRVQILSPDRSVLLGSSELVVRIFAVSGVGIAIGLGAIVVLIIWWRRQRRSSRGTLRAVDIPSPTEARTEVLSQ